MKFLINIALTVFSLCLLMPAYASISNKPFERGALTAEQAKAWQYYVETEANYNNCKYEDDPRLISNPAQLMADLSEDKPIKPVMITYRSLLSMGPHSRALISKNIRIASLECNPVYYTDNNLIGMPTLPFEEALTIIHDDYANNNSAERILLLKDTFFVGNIDPRWFWTFFIADKAHLDMIGLDYQTLLDVESILNIAANKKPIKRNYSKASHPLLNDIFDNLNNNGINFYSDSGKCVKSKAEVKHALFTWPDISPEVVAAFYKRTKHEGYASWIQRNPKNKHHVKQPGMSKYLEEPMERPESPYFNYHRDGELESRECK